MGKLKATIARDNISRHLGNSNLGKIYVLTLTEIESLTHLLEVCERKEEGSRYKLFKDSQQLYLSDLGNLGYESKLSHILTIHQK